MVAILGITRLAAMTPDPPDAHTLHLWHLDESGPPFADNGKSPYPLFGLLNGAQAGQASMPGFGQAVSFDHDAGGTPLTKSLRGASLLAQPRLAAGRNGAEAARFPIMGADGAFTIEALVKFNRLPADAPGMALDIVSMDDAGVNRVFMLRVDKPGFLNFTRFADGQVRGGALATVPVTGPHAINTQDWFHVAATYDGNEGVPGNLALFWTRVAAGQAGAHEIGRGSLPADLGEVTANFAIGNTGRTEFSHRECNPFPGLIDEVRISGIARRPEDYFFVDPASRARAAANPELPKAAGGPPKLDLRQVLVDERQVAVPRDGGSLVLAPGLHRIDFDFGLKSAVAANEMVEIRCQLEGIDDAWRPAGRGMSVIAEVLDAAGKVVSRTIFSCLDQSPQWTGDLSDAPLTPRREPIFLEGHAHALRLTMSSGTPDTTGQMVIDDIMVNLPGGSGGAGNFWKNSELKHALFSDRLSGVAEGWQRGGEDPAIAPLVQRVADNKALGLVDGSQTASGFWTCTQELPPLPAGGATALLGWSQAHNITGGGLLRATYVNVPAGEYHFRAIAVTGGPQAGSDHLKLEVRVRQSPWESPWFKPLAASLAVGLVGLAILQTYRRRASERLAKLEMRHTLERDRARIARDLHDDLGTRVSGLMMGASLVQRDMDSDPAATRRHLTRLNSSAHELVSSMDALVWAVDPANDTLDQLASRLTGMVQEVFRDSGIKAHIALPIFFPAMPLRSEFRHHVSLAVKESLNNVLKHAGPCEVDFELAIVDGSLHVLIRDSGRGFDPAALPEGNGLFNLHSRLAELGGTCEIDSIAGEGTSITFRCPLEKPNNRSHPK
jgi:signal transduction histidine kinase